MSDVIPQDQGCRHMQCLRIHINDFNPSSAIRLTVKGERTAENQVVINMNRYDRKRDAPKNRAGIDRYAGTA